MPLLVLLVALIPIVISDLRRRIIPDVVVVPASIVAIAAGIASGRGPWWHPIGSALLVGGALLGPALVRPDGLGMGDVKVAALMGAALGAVPGLLALLAGLLVAAGWGLAMAVARHVRPASIALPLAPFLAAGVVAVVLPMALVHSAW